MAGKHMAAIAVLALILGIGAGALAQLDSIQRQYEARLRDTDMASAEALYQLARWCYQNDLRDEAMKHAVAALKLAPKDVRAKYLAYLLSGKPAEEIRPETTEGEGDAEAIPTMIAPDLTDEQVARVYETETREVMEAFGEFQGRLINSCARTSCHGGGNREAKFILTRTNPNAQRTRAQNLVAIRPYVNREAPAESRLLQVPLQGKEAGHPAKVFRSENDMTYRAGIKFIDALLTESEKLWKREETDGGGGSPFD